jgi:hypothetical protein
MPEYARVAKGIPTARLGAFLSIAGRAVSDVRRAARPRLMLEIALARMCGIEDAGALGDLARRLDDLAQGRGGSDPDPVAARTVPSAPPPPPAPVRPTPREEPVVRSEAAPHREAPAAPPPDFGEPPDDEPAAALVVPEGEIGRVWKDLVERVGRRKRMLGSFLGHGVPVVLDDASLAVVFENNYHEGMVLRRENLAMIREELALASGRPLEFHAKVGRAPGSARATPEGPADRPSDSRDLLTANPGLKRVIEQLGGQVLPGGQ